MRSVRALLSAVLVMTGVFAVVSVAQVDRTPRDGSSDRDRKVQVKEDPTEVRVNQDSTSEAVMPRAGLAHVQAVPSDAPQPAPVLVAEQPRATTMPPWDQIPPAPMPDFSGQVAANGPGSAVFYDAVTGLTELSAPGKLAGSLDVPGRSPGYEGIFGGDSSEIPPGSGSIAGFGTMSKITVTASFPWRMNVKLVMRFVDQTGADRWFGCSGTMIDAETILTAGHCVYARTANGPDIFDWAEEIFVYPGRNGSLDPYGFARGTTFGAFPGWTNDGNFDWDAGLVRVTRAVGQLTGWFGKAWDGSCAWVMGQTYHNASYPGENCPTAGLHNGADMYYWFGSIDSCPSDGRRLQIDTGGGNCLDTLWGGMSGSGAYYIDGASRFVHAVASTSNRNDVGRYCKLWGAWATFMNGTFIPDSRTSSFDLQALDVNAAPITIPAGDQLTPTNFLATNPTNASASGTWVFRTYLSTNDNISSSDTLLSTKQFNFNFAAMASVRVNMGLNTIPVGTSPGTYWFGVIFDPATDGTSSNNDTDGWDAVQLTVTAPRPANDDCSNAIVISSVPFDPPLLNTTTATTAGTDPLQSCTSGGASTNSHSVWYKYTPPCNGTIDVSTCRSRYDTVVSVYTGSCGGLAQKGCNDDSCFLQSEISALAVVGGRALFIEVTAYGTRGSGGNLDFHLDFTANVPFNDLCSDAGRISVGGNVHGTTCGATEDSAPLCGIDNTSPGVWYRVSGTGHRMTASTCNDGTDYDTKISVFCADCASLPCVDGNDDPDGTPTECMIGSKVRKARVSWCSQYGSEYLILVHGFRQFIGDFELSVTDDGTACTGAVDCGGAAVGACCGADGGQCLGGVCDSFETCQANNFCFCGFNTEGGGRCFFGANPCSASVACPNGSSDCPPGETCWAQSCCDGPICAPDCSTGSTANAEAGGFPSLDDGLLRPIGSSGSVAGTVPQPAYQCLETTPDTCAAATGVYQGDATACDAVDCPGACCVTGQCVGVMTESACLGQSGAWFVGDDCTTVSCPVEGACCAGQGCTEGFVCDQTVGFNSCNGSFSCFCANTVEGSFACVPVTASCGDVCTASSDCQAGFACATDSCCSNAPNVCVPAGCTGGNLASAEVTGDFLGDMPSPGSGQLAGAGTSGECFEIELDTCALFGGQFQGNGVVCVDTTCPGPLGACCVDGSCTGVGEQADCSAQGGNWFPGRDCSNVSCPQPQACCFFPGPCSDLLRATCLVQGGQPQGTGTRCTSDACVEPEACCLSTGECGAISPNDCRERGGAPQGPGSRCLGDQNNNGQDDACELDQPCQDCGPGEHWIERCPGGEDAMPSGAVIGLDNDGDCIPDISLRLSGTVRILRSDPLDDSNLFRGTRPVDGHFDVLDTEIVSMVLSGGGVNMVAGGGLGQGGVLRRSLGTIAEQDRNSSLADSFYDVYFEIELGPRLFAYNQEPVRVQTKIDCLPPIATYIHPQDCIKLYDSPILGQGRVVAYLVTADHSTFPGCGDPSAGDCFEPNVTPYCDDAECCEAVCAVEERCCTESWKPVCAELAVRECPLSDEGCCLPDGRCVETDRRTCEAERGIPQGPGSRCSSIECPLPREACCFSTGECSDMDPRTCEEQGGHGQGPNTSCATTTCPLPREACCLPDGVCIMLDVPTCEARRGQSQGASSTCDQVTCPLPPEACCLPGGACRALDPRECRANLGVPLGPNSRCQGNVSGGQTDGACEPNTPCDQCGPGNHWLHNPTCPPGADHLPSGALVGIDLDFDCVADVSVVLFGPSTVVRTGPRDDSTRFPGLRPVDGHLDVVDTEMVSMVLANPASGITLRVGGGTGTIPLAPSFGAIAEQPSSSAFADSFFEIFFEVDFRGLLLYNDRALRVVSKIDCVPPDTVYIHPEGCIPLFRTPTPAPGEAPFANFVSARHDTFLRCGSESAGDCFQPNGTPYCSDGTCCGRVCELKPFCCDVGWDDECAGAAQEVCEQTEACCLPEGRCIQVFSRDCAERGGIALGEGTRCEGDLDGNGVDEACELDAPCDDCGPGEHWIDSCPGGNDNMPSAAIIGLDLNFDCEVDLSLVLFGPVSIWRAPSSDVSVVFPDVAIADGHRDVIDTEMVSLQLTNVAAGITLRAGVDMGVVGFLPPTRGVIVEQPGSKALADSFFEVFFEVDFGGGNYAYNHTPLKVEAEITCVPPVARYIHPQGCIPLFDIPVGLAGTPRLVANLVTADHSSYPKCGDAATGNCFVPNGTPFCDEDQCCRDVCAELPQCCVAGWDDVCARAAQEICRPTEACCLRDTSCVDVEPRVCIELGGQSRGVDSTCDNTTCRVPDEACCFPEGLCGMATPGDCIGEGGVPLGPGTRCEGDRDGNQIDDACDTDEKCEECGPGDHWVDNCPGGNDHMPTGALIGFDLDGDCLEDMSLVLHGPVSIWRSGSRDDSVQFPNTRPIDGHRDVIDTEIVSMVLSNQAMGVTLVAGEGLGQSVSLNASFGVIAEQPGVPALADSFFDVFVEVDLQGQLLTNATPMRITTKIDCLPPNARYLHPVGCTPLFDVTGRRVANLVTANHSTFPKCGDEVTGDCLTPNFTPFCDDGPCCELVCGELPRCCTHAWDELCVQAAEKLCGQCPAVRIVRSEPPHQTVDARQPHAHDSPLPRQGIGTAQEPIIVKLDGDVTRAETCFNLCETAQDQLLGPNSIIGVTDLGGGVYEIVLDHAITAGAVTTIEYKGSGDQVAFVSHPGNADAGPVADQFDVVRLMDCCLRRVCTIPGGVYSCDIDRSGERGPGDLIRIIDLLEGGATYSSWFGTPRPIKEPCILDR